MGHLGQFLVAFLNDILWKILKGGRIQFALEISRNLLGISGDDVKVYLNGRSCKLPWKLGNCLGFFWRVEKSLCELDKVLMTFSERVLWEILRETCKLAWGSW